MADNKRLRPSAQVGHRFSDVTHIGLKWATVRSVEGQGDRIHAMHFTICPTTGLSGKHLVLRMKRHNP